MKKLTILIFLPILLFWTPEIWACRPPDNADVDIGRTGIIFHFSWNADSGPISCEEDEAIEFEFIIDTAPLQKCFAQPLSGKDQYDDVADLIGFQGYTDVWNYYFDYTDEEVHNILLDQCGYIDPSWAAKANSYDAWFDLDDDVANFAFGTTDTQQFLPGVEYEMIYPLEIPDREECQNSAADDGYVQVNMVVMPNTCTLDNSNGFFSTEETTYDCPHLLGFNRCNNFETQVRYTLQNRICAPTGGVWEIENPADTHLVRGGGACIDADNDGVFENSPTVELYGNNLLDCNHGPGIDGDSGPTNLEILYPNPQRTNYYEQTLVTVVRADDPDGIKQFTVTIDDFQSEACKPRKFVSLGPSETEYLLTLDLAACLGSDYGDHWFRIWAVDRCGNAYVADTVAFRYSGETDSCNNISTGEITYADFWGNVRYEVEDQDGIVLISLNANGIDEDRCKFRQGVRQNGSERILDRRIDTMIDLDHCFILEDEVLNVLYLWVADRCGNVTMVDSLQLQ